MSGPPSCVRSPCCQWSPEHGRLDNVFGQQASSWAGSGRYPVRVFSAVVGTRVPTSGQGQRPPMVRVGRAQWRSHGATGEAGNGTKQILQSALNSDGKKGSIMGNISPKFLLRFGYLLSAGSSLAYAVCSLPCHLLRCDVSPRPTAPLLECCRGHSASNWSPHLSQRTLALLLLPSPALLHPPAGREEGGSHPRSERGSGHAAGAAPRVSHIHCAIAARVYRGVGWGLTARH